MLDYAALFTLAAVVREGSFERAARALHVTPSAVSQRIRLLEERVGGALVTRTQPCEATATGRHLCQHADLVRLLEHELKSALPNLQTDERVSVPVAANADSLATWLMPAVLTMTQATPALMQLAIDDEGHTADWLRSGKVLAAVTASAQPATGCNSVPLGTMRYVATASPAFARQHFAGGVNAGNLARAPSMKFSPKDEMQWRWAQRECGKSVELPFHTLPSPQAFVAATLGGMGWGLHPKVLVAEHINAGRLVTLGQHPNWEVPLYWQHVRLASSMMKALTDAVLAAARSGLTPPA